MYREICYSKTNKSVEKVYKIEKMKNPDYFNGMGVAESVGDTFNLILHTSVLQIKVFQGHYIKNRLFNVYFKYF